MHSSNPRCSARPVHHHPPLNQRPPVPGTTDRRRSTTCSWWTCSGRRSRTCSTSARAALPSKRCWCWRTRWLGASSTCTASRSSIATSNRTTFWWASAATATSCSSSTLDWPRSTETRAHASTFCTARTRTWPVLPGGFGGAAAVNFRDSWAMAICLKFYILFFCSKTEFPIEKMHSLLNLGSLRACLPELLPAFQFARFSKKSVFKKLQISPKPKTLFGLF